jgi:hypothetical protein
MREKRAEICEKTLIKVGADLDAEQMKTEATRHE